MRFGHGCKNITIVKKKFKLRKNKKEYKTGYMALNVQYFLA